MLLEGIGFRKQRHDLMLKDVTALIAALEDVDITELADRWMTLYGFDDRSEINQGLCEDFARDVKTLWHDVTTMWDDEIAASEGEDIEGSHCVIVHEGRYYDAECPEGVDNWRSLPYFGGRR